jgi:hypothetical protein
VLKDNVEIPTHILQTKPNKNLPTKVYMLKITDGRCIHSKTVPPTTKEASDLGQLDEMPGLLDNARTED